MNKFIPILIVSYLFMGCLTTWTDQEGFQYWNIYTNDKPSINIQGYKGNNINLVIPETINGKPVTIIGSYAFENIGLESAIIPSSVREIGYSAFNNNNLTSVIIPPGVKEISYNAFRNNKLISVTIPSSVLTISKGAFIGNNLSLPNINIPEHLKHLLDNIDIFDPFPQLIVVNQLSVPIVHLYLSPAGENTWEDILSDPIVPGNGYGTNWIYRIKYDIRAEDSNGNTYSILDQDFSVNDGSIGKMLPITAARKD